MSFSKLRLDNDISVLVLKEPVDLHKHLNIKPVCLPHSVDIDNTPADGWYVGNKTVVSGWGRIKNEGFDAATHLQVPKLYTLTELIPTELTESNQWY